MFQAALLSFAVGFLSLSLEILWIRLVSFANHSLPQAFAFVLIFYLLGIAVGAHIGKRFCNNKYPLWKVAGIVLMISGVVDFLSPWMYVAFIQTFLHLSIAGLLIICTALLKAILFPIAHYLGAPLSDMMNGRRISRVYVANILGATIGPLITGMVLLDIFSTQQCFIICSCLTILVATICLLKSDRRTMAIAVSIPLMLILFSFIFTLDSHLLIAFASPQAKSPQQVIENSNGIITIYAGGGGGDIIEGGNVYDGRSNLDPVINSNGINRLLILSALQDQPERVLMIGLSIGSWLKVITSFPNVRHIDVVEINPGYIEAMANYPRQLSALKDPRVTLYIDDGRRWLTTHADKKYDLVINNTSYYWRAYTANLLSQEFIRLVKQHMEPNAVLAYNTTSSPDAFKTASTVFRYAYLYENFVIAADFNWPPLMRTSSAARKLAALQLDHHSLFPSGSDLVIQSYLHEPLYSIDQVEKYYAGMGRKLQVITDENLITEFKYGMRL